MSVLDEKLQILADAAKYDVSCSSSGSDRSSQAGSLGNAAAAGICHSWADDGRCISLLKILFSNVCVYDCVYCHNRASNDIPRASFTPEEVASLTINFYRRNYIEGLFLSSGVILSPDYTMEQLLKTVKILREREGFRGYIHLKAIPGADLALIRQAGLYVDRMSVNIELPSAAGLKALAPQKDKDKILLPMDAMTNEIKISQQERRQKKNFRLLPFVPAGQTTQMIVGATPDSDYQILKLSSGLYQKFALKRVYYSAYIPVNQDNRLPALALPPLKRENRLYQADWLLRFYQFKVDEILSPAAPSLEDDFDPKLGWALRNLNLFPVDVNRADYEMLLRVPGIGLKSAMRIIRSRRQAALNFDHLKKLGVVLKRAAFFITCTGKTLFTLPKNEETFRTMLSLGNAHKKERFAASLF